MEVFDGVDYRWKAKTGSEVIGNVVKYFELELKWDWGKYIDEAEPQKDNNYKDDKLLKIKYIGFKLRDLALSNFSPHYAAFDLHVTRVLTRLGWLNYGFSCLGNTNLEMGNNSRNHKNYIFLHKLFILLSEMTKKTKIKYTPVDIDRIFWHLGRSLCGDITECNDCPIAGECLTGKSRITAKGKC